MESKPSAVAVAGFVRAATHGKLDRAQALLVQHPTLPQTDIYAAAVCGDLPTLQRIVAAAPELITATGGPREGGWTLLHYVAFSALQMASAEAQGRATTCAKWLLAQGADVNAAWYEPEWEKAPLRALFGACGLNNNPALARVLLAAGALRNDGEALYHAAEHNHRECLEVLLAAGDDLSLEHPLWTNTPLYFLLGYQPWTPRWTAVRDGIRWLLEHGADPNVPSYAVREMPLHQAVRQRHDRAMLELLLNHGADAARPAKNGRTPFALALLTGHRDAIALFRERGVPAPVLTPKEDFLATCFAGDAATARRMLQVVPGMLAMLDEDERLSLGLAAQYGDGPALEAMVAVGFDLAFKGTRPWGATPLHQAAWRGHAAAVRALLAHGAPVDVEANPPVQGSPLNWAAHGSKNFGNPAGDYPGVVRALLAAGAKVNDDQIAMATPEVAALLRS